MRLKLVLSFFLFAIFSVIMLITVSNGPEVAIPDIEYTHVGKLERIEQLNFKPVKIEIEDEIVENIIVAQEVNNPTVPKEQTKLTLSRNAELSTAKIFTVTAYDLSVQSCGKEIGHPSYGLTASGFNLTGLSRGDAMSIAADRNVIPMGSQVKVTFTDPNYTQYDGIYTVRDTGGAIKGYKIDLFMGDFQSNTASQEAMNFGVTKAEVVILK